MGLNIIAWILFGALVGWLASIIMRTDEEQGAMSNIIIGIIGAFLGGALSGWLGGPGVSGFNLSSIVVATLGAVVLIFFIRLITRGRGSSAHHY